MDGEAPEAGRRHIPGGRFKDVRLQPQPFGAAEHVAVLPIDLSGRSVVRRVFCRCANGVGEAVLDIDLVGQAALRIQRLALDDPHAADRRNFAQARAGVLDHPRRIRIARLDIEERARDGRAEAVRADQRRFAERRDGTRRGDERDVHGVRLVVHHRRDRQDLGQRPALLAEIIDYAVRGRAQAARGGSIAGLEADHPVGQRLGRQRLAGPIDDADHVQPEERPRIDANDHRRDRPVAIAFGGANKGDRVRRKNCDACAADRNGDGRIIVAEAPQRINDLAEIVGRAARQRVAVRRRVLAQLVERRGVHHRVLDAALAAGHVDRHRIGDRGPRDGGRRVVRTEQAEKTEGVGAVGAAEQGRSRRSRDDQARAPTLGSVSGSPVHQTRTPYPRRNLAIPADRPYMKQTGPYVKAAGVRAGSATERPRAAVVERG